MIGARNWNIFDLLTFPDFDGTRNFKATIVAITRTSIWTICLKLKVIHNYLVSKVKWGHCLLTSHGQSRWASRNFDQQSRMHWFESHSSPHSVMIEHFYWLSKSTRAAPLCLAALIEVFLRVFENLSLESVHDCQSLWSFHSLQLQIGLLQLSQSSQFTLQGHSRSHSFQAELDKHWPWLQSALSRAQLLAHIWSLSHCERQITYASVQYPSHFTPSS